MPTIDVIEVDVDSYVRHEWCDGVLHDGWQHTEFRIDGCVGHDCDVRDARSDPCAYDGGEGWLVHVIGCD